MTQALTSVSHGCHTRLLLVTPGPAVANAGKFLTGSAEFLVDDAGSGPISCPSCFFFAMNLSYLRSFICIPCAACHLPSASSAW